MLDDLEVFTAICMHYRGQLPDRHCQLLPPSECAARATRRGRLVSFHERLACNNSATMLGWSEQHGVATRFAFLVSAPSPRSARLGRLQPRDVHVTCVYLSEYRVLRRPAYCPSTEAQRRCVLQQRCSVRCMRSSTCCSFTTCFTAFTPVCIDQGWEDSQQAVDQSYCTSAHSETLG